GSPWTLTPPLPVGVPAGRRDRDGDPGRDLRLPGYSFTTGSRGGENPELLLPPEKGGPAAASGSGRTSAAPAVRPWSAPSCRPSRRLGGEKSDWVTPGRRRFGRRGQASSSPASSPSSPFCCAAFSIRRARTIFPPRPAMPPSDGRLSVTGRLA